MEFEKKKLKIRHRRSSDFFCKQLINESKNLIPNFQTSNIPDAGLVDQFVKLLE